MKVVLQFHPDQLAEVKKRVLRHVEEVGFKPENQGRSLHEFAVIVEVDANSSVVDSKVVSHANLQTHVFDEVLLNVIQEPEKFLKPGDMFVLFRGKDAHRALSSVSRLLNSFPMESGAGG